MVSRFRQWLNAVPLRDPLERRQAPLIQMMLLGLIIAAALVLPTTFGGNYSVVVRWLEFATPTLILLTTLGALFIFRRGHVRPAALLAISGLLLGFAIGFVELGLQNGPDVLSGMLLPIVVAGFLLGRRGLIFTVSVSITIVALTAVLEENWPSLIKLGDKGYSSSAAAFGFALTACLAALFVDQFVSTLRTALDDALARERELERSSASLEVRTAELSNAKEALEHELSIRKRVEEALVYERDLLHALLDNIPDLIYFKDTSSRFIRVNHAQATLLGVDHPDEAVGKTDFDFQTADLAQSFFSEERQIVETGQPLIDRIEYNPTPDGQPRWLSATKVPIIDKQGAVAGIIGVSRDITARQEVDLLKSEFISIVSHELRTPLTAIRGSLGLLVGDAIGTLPDSVRAMIDIGYRNTDRLLALINDLLDMEKIESGKFDFVCIPIELSSLLDRAIEANSVYGAQFGVMFRPTEMIPEAWVYADSDRLMQVFTNLLSNAAKFSPANSTVHVAVMRHDLMLRVSITDRGPGIPRGFHSRIFGKFAQADSSDTRQKGGTGLGLSIAKAIVERLGGEISFTTEMGVGTTFYVDLPEWREEIRD
jgi:PAS domain S-box-containing protein